MKNSQEKNHYTYEFIKNDPLKIRIYTLKNHLKVYLSKNNNEPRIQTFISVRAGSSKDPINNTGLAHYLEHMLFKGTSKIGTNNWEKEKILIEQISNLYEKHKCESNIKIKKKIYKKINELSQKASKFSIPNEYDQLLSSIGARGTNAYTSLDETVYINNIPSNELEKWIRIEKERFSKLVLRLFHTELETVYEEYNRSQDNEFDLISNELMSALFPTHPYGQQTILGSSKDLKNPSMKSIHKFFNTYYVPNNMAIILVGNLNYDLTIKLINTYFNDFSPKKISKNLFKKEKKINSIIKREVFSPSSEKLSLAFRAETDEKKNILKLEIIDMILYNSKAGLIDLNLIKKHKVSQIISHFSLYNHYAIHRFSGIPKDEQTLDELKILILNEIENIKKGNFEEWIIQAIINDLEMQRIKEQENNENLASHLVQIFIRNESYEEYLNKFTEMRKISKKELMDFAKDFYKDNYVIIYKKKGENKNLIKIENPKITPIKINRKEHSNFFKEITSIPIQIIKPKWIDYSKEIQKDKLKNIPFYFIKNTKNSLASIHYLFQQGSDHNQKLTLAFKYLKYLGTEKKTVNEFAKNFYHLGINFEIRTLNDKSIISLFGLSINIPKGIKLLEELLKKVKSDENSFKKLIKNILKQRKDAKNNKDSLIDALNNYSIYGSNNRFTQMITSDELQKINPNELIELIKKITDYFHEIFYFGDNKSNILQTLIKHHNTGKNLPNPPSKNFEPQIGNRSIYVVDYDMVQVEISLYKRNQIFKKENILKSMLLNEYFGYGLSSIVFQEIRESKSLGYSAYFVIKTSKTNKSFDQTHAYLGTQTDKLKEAIFAMIHLTKKFPKIKTSFDFVKKIISKNLASQRIQKENIFWNYQILKKLGIYEDIRKEMYDQIKSITIQDLEKYFNETIRDGEYNYSIISNKNSLNFSVLNQLGEVIVLSSDDLFGK